MSGLFLYVHRVYFILSLQCKTIYILNWANVIWIISYIMLTNTHNILFYEILMRWSEHEIDIWNELVLVVDFKFIEQYITISKYTIDSVDALVQIYVLQLCITIVQFFVKWTFSNIYGILCITWRWKEINSFDELVLYHKNIFRILV